MLAEAKKKGLTNTDKMWDSIAAIEPILSIMEEEHPDEYHAFMKKQHEALFGSHYDEEWANADVEKLKYTDKDGKQHTGAHWTKAEILKATEGMTFPNGTTDCDKYVAFNSMYAALNKDFSDGDIIKAAHRYYFADEDAPDGKVWKTLSTMKKKK